MSAIEAEIETLKQFRDRYFAAHADGTVEQKRRALKEKAALLLQDVPLPAADACSKARHCYLSGCVLNALLDYDARCEELLSRAVKLEPSLAEAWNELGECQWKKGDTATALNCFETALQKQRNASSLRLLSVALRQAVGATAERRDNVRRSLALALEASQLAPDDSASWYFLGNAYMVSFFAGGQQVPSYMAEASRAYKKALDLEAGQYNADLYFNYAQVLRFEQAYQEALDCLQKSARLDPTLTVAAERKDNLVSFLRRVHDCVSRKGKLKPKRLAEFSASVSQRAPTSAAKLTETTMGQLSEGGGNDGALLVCRVVGVVFNEEAAPYAFVAVDAEEACALVTVYNCSAAFGVVIGNTVSLVHPFVIDVHAQHDGETFAFRCVRVASPHRMLVNGKPPAKETMAVSDVSVTALPS